MNDKHVITIDGVGEQTITITPSEEEQTLTIRHPDFETQTESFTLKDDGGEIAITVSLNPKQPTAGSTSGTESNRQMSRSDSDDVDRDVADALDIPVGTVKSRLHRALTHLAELLEAPHA